jgi:hypothetical protein
MNSAWKQGAIGLALVGAGVLAGGTVSSVQIAHGELRHGTPPPPAFQSGAQLSVPVLREIAATLQQIDARIERLETMAKRMQAPRAAATSALRTGE